MPFLFHARARVQDWHLLHNNEFGIVMEFCELGTLRAWLGQGRPSELAVTELMLQLANGVAFLHEHGVFHRDLKPENIMLQYAPMVKGRKPHTYDQESKKKYLNE